MNWINGKTIAAIIGASLLTGTATYLVQQRQIARLQDANQRQLAEQRKTAAELDSVQASSQAKDQELAQFRKNSLELAQLRNEVGMLRQPRKTESQPSSSTQRQAVAPPPGAYLAKDQLAFVGYDTPEAALISITYNMLNASLDTLSEGLSVDIKKRDPIDDKARQEFAERQKTSAPLIKGIQIVAKKTLPDGNIELKVKMDADPMPGQNRPPPPFVTQPMVREGNAWRLGGSTHEYMPAWDNSGVIERFDQ